MYSLLLKIMLGAALIQVGLTLSDFTRCHNRECLKEVERRSKNILRIEWKPISVFPEEAKRFR